MVKVDIKVSLPRTYYGSTIPTTGNYQKGDIIINTNPSVGGIFCWSRLTTGTNNTLGTDWLPVQLGALTSISSVPLFVGQHAVVSGIGYISTGTTSVSDWKQITN